jgi:nitrogen fixation/metabolism regulation signal transduction histidine kinase
MNRWAARPNILKSPRFIPLRYRLVLANGALLIVLLGVLALTLVWFQSRTSREQLEQRGEAIGRSIAATSIKALLGYDYISLEQFANQAAQDPNILYVVVHDKEDYVAGFSNRPDLQGQKLSDEISRRATASTGPLVQKATTGPDGPPGLEVAIPVLLPDSSERWGTVRVCLSLAPLYLQLRQTIWIVIVIGVAALCFGTMFSILGAKRITRPLGDLVRASEDVARGNYQQDIRVKTGDEVEVLAESFSTMTREILAHQRRRQQQLEEIKRLRDYTDKLMTTMADGLLSIDVSGTVATINPAACRLLSLPSPSTATGQSIATVCADSPELLGLIETIMTSSEPVNLRELDVERGESGQTLLISSSILYNSEKRPHEIILNLHDITELKRLEARIRQSERLAALGTLAAGMAHEIRNPLSAIKTFVQLLPRKIDTPGFLEKFNRTVPRETQRINLLVEELLELSRAPKYKFKATDIRSLVEQAVDLFHPELVQQGIEIRIEVKEPIPPVQADANQLVKAFYNLIRNGLQAMENGGELVIEMFVLEASQAVGDTETDGAHELCIIIQDTGQGMTGETLKQIFNPFFTTKDSGTGLGLPITHKVITEHGGRIVADSVEGKGTRFTVTLPLKETSLHCA